MRLTTAPSHTPSTPDVTPSASPPPLPPPVMQMRDLNEVINTRVAWLSITALLVCLTMAGWQLYYLQRFLKRKKVGGGQEVSAGWVGGRRCLLGGWGTGGVCWVGRGGVCCGPCWAAVPRVEKKLGCHVKRLVGILTSYPVPMLCRYSDVWTRARGWLTACMNCYLWCLSSTSPV